ncbi:MAG: response regulator [Candidatus Riflebacteria bacterium]|nr:response regulator [Candidatus Riflebacteria bacterium]
MSEVEPAPAADACVKRARSILLLDDDLSSARFFEEVLRSDGYEVTAIESERVAVERFRNACPDLVLADLDLACRNDFTILHYFHGSQPGIPVIVLAGRLDYGRITQALRRGAHDFIQKASDPEELLKLLQRACTNSVQGVPTNREVMVFEKPEVEKRLKDRLTEAGYEVFDVGTQAQLKEVLTNFDIDVVVAGQSITPDEVLELVTHCHEQRPELPVVVLPSAGEAALAVECLRRGAFDVADHILTDEELVGCVRRAYDRKSLTDARNKRDRERQIYDAHVERLGRQLEGEVRARTEELVKQKGLLEQILSAIPSGLVVVDTEGTVTAVNPAALSILGLDGQTVIGRSAESIVPLEPFAEEIGRTIGLRQTVPRAQLETRLPDGSVRMIGFTLVPLLGASSDPATGAVLHLKDITAQRGLGVGAPQGPGSSPGPGPLKLALGRAAPLLDTLESRSLGMRERLRALEQLLEEADALDGAVPGLRTLVLDLEKGG